MPPQPSTSQEDPLCPLLSYLLTYGRAQCVPKLNLPPPGEPGLLSNVDNPQVWSAANRAPSISCDTGSVRPLAASFDTAPGVRRKALAMSTPLRLKALEAMWHIHARARATRVCLTGLIRRVRSSPRLQQTAATIFSISGPFAAATVFFS